MERTDSTQRGEHGDVASFARRRGPIGGILVAAALCGVLELAEGFHAEIWNHVPIGRPVDEGLFGLLRAAADDPGEPPGDAS